MTWGFKLRTSWPQTNGVNLWTSPFIWREPSRKLKRNERANVGILGVSLKLLWFMSNAGRYNDTLSLSLSNFSLSLFLLFFLFLSLSLSLSLFPSLSFPLSLSLWHCYVIDLHHSGDAIYGRASCEILIWRILKTRLLFWQGWNTHKETWLLNWPS